MTDSADAHAPHSGGRSVRVIVNDEDTWTHALGPQPDEADETRTVALDDILPALTMRYGSDPFSNAELARVIEEQLDEREVSVSDRGAKYVARQLLDPDSLGGPQLGTTPTWEYRLASYVREQYAPNAT